MKIYYFYLKVFFITITLSHPIFAQWTQTNGPNSASITSLAASGTDIYVGTGGGGIFYSANSGSSFSYVNNNMYSTTITAIDIESFGVLAGTGGSGVFITSNQGASWTLISTGITNLNINSIVSIGSNIFAATGGGGVFLSMNNGNSWSAVNSGLTNLSVNKLYVSGTSLYAGTSNGGFVSTNYGTSWTAITSTLSNKNIKTFLVNGTRIFVGNNTGVFYSDNGGTSWTTPTTNTGYTTNSLEIIGTTLFAAATNGGCFRSTNNGADWTASNTFSGLFNKSGNVLVKNGTTLLYGSNGGGLYKSTDNASNWTDNNNGITSSTVRAILENNGKLYAGVQGGGIYTSTNSGTTWIQQSNGITDFGLNFLAFASSGTTIFAAAQSYNYPPTTAGIFYTTNAGSSWTQCFSGKSVFSLATSSQSGVTKIFAGMTDGLYYSSNNGGQWTNISTITSGTVQAIAFDGALGCAAKYNVGRLYITTDYGNNWSQASGTVPNTNIQSITITGNTIVVGTSNGVYKTTDNGTTWISFNEGLPAFLSVNSIAKATGSGNSPNIKNNNDAFIKNSGVNSLPLDFPVWIICTQNDGPYVSTGGSWKQMLNGLGNGTSNYTLHVAGDKVYLGTFAYGISSSLVTTLINNLLPNYTITVSSNPAEAGQATVVGGPTFQSGSSVTVSAVAIYGYKFINWTENGNEVSKEPSFTFPASANRNLVANFAKAKFTLTTISSPSAGGITSGGGSFDYGQKVTVTATPNIGFKFVSWSREFTAVPGFVEYSKFPSCEVEVLTDITMKAKFDSVSCKITAIADPSVGGVARIYQDGTDFTLSERVVKYQSNVQLLAVENDGYKFVSWTEDGKVVSLSKSLTIVADGDRNLVAKFSKIKYKLTISTNLPGAGKIKINGELISANEIEYDHNTSINITAEANDGYAFLNYTENGTEVSPSSVFKFNILANRTLVVNFIQTKCKLTLSCNPVEAGKVYGAGSYGYGEEVEIWAQENPGYKFKNWSENGTIVSVPLVFKLLLKTNRSLVANFDLITTCKVSLFCSPPEGGTAHGEGEYQYSTFATVTAVPNAGYKFVGWIKDLDTIAFNHDLEYTFPVYWDITLEAKFESDGATNINETNNSLPLDYHLYQNYPNPFNPATTIKFALPNASNVKICLYNNLGKETMVITNKYFSAGTHIITINMENLVSGVYFYTMMSGTFTDTKKLLLLK